MSAGRASPDRPRAILDHLISQRRAMRDDAVDQGLREANRLAIIYWQLELSRVLAGEHESASRG